MEKKIIDYLHLYLPVEMIQVDNGNIKQYFLTSIDLSYKVYGKPILRPLSDMTEEEKIMLCCMNLGNEWKPGHIIQTNDEDIAAMRVFDHKGNYKSLYIPKARIAHNNFLWLLKQGFDLFGLIDAGLAIDKTNPTNLLHPIINNK